MTVDRERVLEDYRRTCAELERHLAAASDAWLNSPSRGTRWNNEQLLFHMVFGFMVTLRLLPLVHLVSRLPSWVGRGWARLLDTGTGPFDAVNYLGSRAAARWYNRHRMAGRMRRTVTALAARLERETDRDLERTMDFPPRWDPFFTARMSLGQVYAYPVRHFDFHARQLSPAGD